MQDKFSSENLNGRNTLKEYLGADEGTILERFLEKYDGKI
jgi:hypothetical protein